VRANIDTDVIIRIERLAALKRSELGAYAFEALRFKPDGSENPDFVLNTADYRGAPILIAGANFGCGSSREHAVWALQGLGIRCVIAPSYGDIFFGNCFQNGLLPVVLPQQTVSRIASLIEASPATTVSVDLERQTVTLSDGEGFSFVVEPARRTQMLEGLDEIAVTLLSESVIDTFQTADRIRRPWIYLPTDGARAND
jgi:3-isopropylmalate/(R)-2-methylmalate dehydratase small subunit